MGLLYGHARRLTTKNAGFRPGQERGDVDFWVVAYDYPEDPGGYDEELELEEVKAFTKAHDDACLDEGLLSFSRPIIGSIGNP